MTHLVGKETGRIKLATAFSGIGAIEHALERLRVPHDIVFASDSGGIDVLADLSPDDREKAYRDLWSIDDPAERKSVVDGLFASSRKTNFVEKSYRANYEIPDERFFRDARFQDGAPFAGEVDLFVAGTPCQSFSMVGDREGFADIRGTLFYDFVRLIAECRPKAFIFENVAGVLSHDDGRTWSTMARVFDMLGYQWGHSLLNAKDYGVPQNRTRLFVVGTRSECGFTFPEPRPLELTMQDLLEDSVAQRYYLPPKGVKFVTDPKNIRKRYTQVNGSIALCQKANQQFNWHGDFVLDVPAEAVDHTVDEKYFLSKKVADYVLASGTKGFYSKPEINLPVARPLLSTMHKMHRSGVDNYVTSEGKIRKLTPRECLRLMGFCDSFEQVVSDTQMYRQAGNSIVVDLLMAIVSRLIEVGAFAAAGEVSDRVAPNHVIGVPTQLPLFGAG